ncbi:hypothetical protein [Streptomyces sp. XC 2026]|uniref:hypothetical protein n=1 Tax=Streptomyces sp. XC 2026 TaxID=2782004 RepID=UPI0019053486|nr:hypothetical protein [Streptomyces sp. XC 2026]QQN79751.1 hypothetical protein IPZ77_21740 [Streptomyces sp. XC 2026]QQN80641.1 hypothetical protein IPZ77_26915 [Streptomyces sp. XC 2026]
MTTLDHLLDRARRGVLLPEEADWLAEWVGELADAQQRYARALDRAHALADDLDGPGSIDRTEAAGLLRDVLDVRPGVWRQTPALSAVAPSVPLSAAVAASGPVAGPERHPGGSTGRQAGAEGVALTAATLRPVPDAPSTAASGPQSAVHGPDGHPGGQGSHGAADRRTAAREIRRLRRDLRQAVENAALATLGPTPSTAEPVTLVAPSLTPAVVATGSDRQRARARKWPWAWWCTRCDIAGAAKTEPEAVAAAGIHAATHAEETA